VVHRRTRASARWRRRWALGVRLATLTLLLSSGALALDPSLDTSQYAHTAWRIRDGFTRGRILAIAQTPDGYLWLGTEFGLFRFDGVRAVPFQPAGEQLPASYITTLSVARDGTLWIGTAKGLASLRDGKLTHHPELARRYIMRIQQDREGTLWFGDADFEGGKPGRLCAVVSAKIQCQEHEGFGPMIIAVYQDHLGNLWVSTGTGLWRWKPGPPDHYSLPAVPADLIEDERGALLMATADGLKRFAGGKVESHSFPGLDAAPRPNSFFRSSDGSLWMGTSHGLVHVHQGKTDVFGVGDGLSHEGVSRIFEDREGNLWVSTLGGLDRFRDYRFPSLSAKQGLSSVTWAVMATPDGSVWMSGTDGLNRWRDGHVTFHGKATGSPPTRQSAMQGSAAAPALESVALSLAVDDHGRLWAANKDGVFYLEEDRFVRVPGLPGGNVWSVAPDRHGNAWVSIGLAGLFHGTGGGGAQQFRWTQFGKSYGATALLPDPSEEGVWLGFQDGGVSHFKDGRVLASYAAADGLGAGSVAHLRSSEQGAVWAATEGGLSRIRAGHVLTLTAKNGLPCDAVHWSVEDDDRSVWLYMTCALVHVERSELEAWLKSPERTIQATAFDASDGVRVVGAASGYGPRVTKSTDGKIWFTPFDGVTAIDPRHLPHNNLPPPVHIEQITADDHLYDATAFRGGRLRLPPRVRDLAIDYTALSLAAPEKVHFRIKLEGQDADFRELVNERHVRYTNLPPKDYRFVVKASNDSGVWNEEGKFLDFTIAPAFDQTTWFRALCASAVVALLWAAYRLRVAALERRQRLLERHEAEITTLNERLMKAQEEERTRIAGELHDGVLQQLATVTVNLGTLKYQAQPDSPAKTGIGELQNELMQIGTGIRQLSHELHPAVLHEAGLPNALSSYCEEFSRTRGVPVSCEAEPQANELSPGAALALYRIAQEALGNVAKHSKAKHAHVRLERADGVVRLTISDDGGGFDPARVGDRGGVGLVNMRERVRQLDGTFALESEPGSGTIIRAEVPFRPA
jgi:signal transduction histidine kinase/ligand-binding sensor domain-containing protein